MTSSYIYIFQDQDKIKKHIVHIETRTINIQHISMNIIFTKIFVYFLLFILFL